VANFGEFRTGEVRRIPLPGTWVNKGKKKGRGPLENPNPASCWREAFLLLRRWL
jgi:hypothetical protein